MRNYPWRGLFPRMCRLDPAVFGGRRTVRSEIDVDGVLSSRLQIGLEIAEMSDGEIVEFYNDFVKGPSSQPNTSMLLPRCPWAHRKSNIMTEAINGLREGVCCAVGSRTAKTDNWSL